jgi:hypothetical protein
MKFERTHVLLQKISHKSNKANSTYKPRLDFRFDAQKSDFDIKVNVQLKDCVQPEDDSRRMSGNLDFIGRPR